MKRRYSLDAYCSGTGSIVPGAGSVHEQTVTLLGLVREPGGQVVGVVPGDPIKRSAVMDAETVRTTVRYSANGRCSC